MMVTKLKDITKVKHRNGSSRNKLFGLLHDTGKKLLYFKCQNLMIQHGAKSKNFLNAGAVLTLSPFGGLVWFVLYKQHNK